MAVTSKADERPRRKRILWWIGGGVAAVALAAAWLWIGLPNAPRAPSYPAAAPHRGGVAKVEHLKGYSVTALRTLMALGRLPVAMPVEQGVELYRITYWTQYKGGVVPASGLFVISRDRRRPPAGVVVWLHGTNATRGAAPSAPSLAEGVIGGGAFAGTGDYFLAPDYIGLGQSKLVPTYMIAQPTVDATVDLLAAARQVAKDMDLPWSPRLFLLGFSQGGAAVAATHRAIDASPLPGYRLCGSAAVAGAYDLTGITVPYALQNRKSFYLAYMAYAYATYYGKPLSSLLRAPWVARVPGLFDGSKDADQISAGLPADPADLFVEGAGFASGRGASAWLRDALDQNATFDWAPKAPLKLLFGTDDHDVSPEDSAHFLSVARAKGGNVTAQPVGPYTHDRSIYFAYPQARTWFRRLAPTCP